MCPKPYGGAHPVYFPSVQRFMALFKSGKSAAAGSEGGRARSRRKQAADPQETLEAIRRRAHYRLLGAALLVGVTVIGLPMLFDQQPRLVPVDAQVSIPDKGDVAPLHASSTETLDVREEFVQPKDEVVPDAAVPMPDAPPQAAAPEPAPQTAKAAADTRDKERKEQQAKAEKERKEKEAKAEKERKEQQAKAEKERKEQQAKADKERKEQQAKADKERKEKEAKAKAEKERKELQVKAEKERKERERKEADAARARDLLEGRTPATTTTASTQEKKQRFVIQIGAFADAQSARQERMKAERAGVKTYIQIIKTGEGERTRVRAGPFTSREEADKAAATLKKLGLPSAVQTL